MKSRFVPVCTLALTFVCVSVAHAVDPIHFITDTRRCVASYSGNGAGSTWEERPTPFSLYTGGANIEVTNGLETWIAHSLQNSRMNGNSMIYTGSGTASAVAVPLSSPLNSQGQSKFDIWFSVNEPTDYSLSGLVGETGHVDSVATVRLTALNGTVLQEASSTANSSRTFDVSGTLQAGTYRLYAEATAQARTSPLHLLSNGTASCSLQFDAGTPLSDPGDWNGDGVVNSADLFDFLGDFSVGRADFNHSGITNSVDLFDFLAVFER